MTFRITKFSVKKARKAVANSSKIEGYKGTKSRAVKARAKKRAVTLCP